MVVSKRCKICTVIESDNMPISGEYFGKLMPEMIAKITGIELDSRKLVDVLICQQCAIQLVHTESVVNKIRERCSKLCKPKSAIRTPSKIVNKTKDATPTRKRKDTSKAVPSPKPNGEAIFKRIADDLDGSTFKDDETTGDVIFEKCMDGTELNRDEATGDVTFKKFTDDLNATILKSVEASPAKKNKSAKRKLEDSHLNGIDASSDLQNIRQSDGGTTNELDKGLFVEKGKRRKKTSLSVTETVGELEMSSTIGAENVGETKTKDINCVLCGKMFNQKSTLREHIETSHMGEKLKECPNCCMEFRSLQKYESHVFGEKCKGILHPCQFDNCHRRFKNVYKMEAHMREKHLSICEVDAE